MLTVVACVAGCGASSTSTQQPTMQQPERSISAEGAGLTPAQIRLMTAGPPDIPPMPSAPFHRSEGAGWDALRAAKSFEIYRLDPEGRMGEKGFYGFKILERKRATDPSPVIATLVTAIEKSGDDLALCFNPRHGIHLETSSGKTYDFVICFECHQTALHVNGAEEGKVFPTDNVSVAMDKAFKKNGL
jgi:hypothetical protein